MADDQKHDDDEPARIPKSRLDEEAAKRKAAERELAELRSVVEELRDRDKPDLERLAKDLEREQKRREDAEKQMQELTAARERDQKAAWLASAAAKANFHDPDAATVFANLDEIEDAKSAEAAVKRLAKERSYLVKTDAPEAQKLQRVGIAGTDGQEVAVPSGGLITPEEQYKRWGEEFARQMGLEPETAAPTE